MTMITGGAMALERLIFLRCKRAPFPPMMLGISKDDEWVSGLQP